MTNNDQNNTSNIERVVMARIHRIYFLRSFLPLVVGGLALAAALLGLGRQVFVARVFENAPQDLAAALQFYLAAFTNTELVVQTLMLITLISLFYLSRASARLLTSTLTPAQA